MSPQATVTIVNTTIVVAIALISTLGFVCAQSSAGLWSMWMLLGFMSLGWNADEIVARAILAERERCATIKPPPLELPGGTYGLAAIEAYWRGSKDQREAMVVAILSPTPIRPLGD